MDILCKHCGEPWDVSELHDMLADDRDSVRPFQEARELFYAHGCGAFQSQPAEDCDNPPIVEAGALEAIDVLQDSLGDDVDGLASALSDFEAIGAF